ncbi:ABC transporter substrate-binding protein [Candidatus Entotheonella palauensis]|nr:ABC transporter substrate-binding protein [Candidatus Entotheonella palauensis]
MRSQDGFQAANAWLESPINRRTFVKALGFGSLGLAASHVLPFSGPGSALAAKPKYGGTIQLAWRGTPDILDPHKTTYLTAVQVHNNIYNGVLRIAYDGTKVSFEPELAEEWEIKSDTDHVFRIRKGVSFHNGDPLTAKDIKWSFERVANREISPIHYWKMKQMDTIEVIDDYTLRLILKQPDPFMSVALTGATGRAGTIVNRRAVEEGGKSYGKKSVIGTGPFKFVEWVENDRIVLERNPNYWEKDADGNQLPYLDKVVIRIVPESSTALAAIMTGELDGWNTAPYQFVSKLRADDRLNVHTLTGGNYIRLSMNVERPPFDDVKVRQAVSHAINREEIVQQAFFGEAIVAHGPISPPMSDYYDKEFESGTNGQYYDLEKAKVLMKESKYPDGAEVGYIVTQVTFQPRIAQIVQAHLAKIGIKVNLQMFENAAWRKRWLESDFDLVLTSPWADLDPDETIYPQFHTGEKWNVGKWSNAEYDKQVEIARGTFDVKTRKAAYDKAVAVLVEECPSAFLAHVNEHKVMANYVKGFQAIPADLVNLHTVWLDKA